MKKLILAVIIGMSILPALALGQAEPSAHLWAVEYSDTHGLTLHRSLDGNWEVFLGGWVSNTDNEEDYQEYRYSDQDGYEINSDRKEKNTRTSSQVHLGVGRSLWQGDNFRFSGLIRLQHYWNEFERLDEVFSPDYSNPAYRKEVGHSNTTTVYFGFRPTYDITPRITLLLEFGVVYSNYSYTKDVQEEDPDDISYFGNSNSRTAKSTDRLGLYGINTLRSISLMFRF